MRLVLVRWIDSAECSNVWLAREDIPIGCCKAISCGFVLEDNEKHIALTRDMTDVGENSEMLNGSMTIPKSAVTEIVELADHCTGGCDTCKHVDVDELNLPCVGCSNDLWEPKDEDEDGDEDEDEDEDEGRDCHSCKYLEDLPCCDSCSSCFHDATKPNFVQAEEHDEEEELEIRADCEHVDKYTHRDTDKNENAVYKHLLFAGYRHCLICMYRYTPHDAAPCATCEHIEPRK